MSADLARLKASSAARSALKYTVKTETGDRASFTEIETSPLANLNRPAKGVNVEAVRVKKDPADSAAAAQLKADPSALQTAASDSSIPADATTRKLATADSLAPISAVASTDAELQADVLAAQTNAYAIGHALQARVTIATDAVTQIQSDAQS
jgi:hypothetical protein